jgi:Protein of unknown function (DUF3303)
MLFMVIEHFKQADLAPIGERFLQKGRMLPEGVVYHTSWVDSAGTRCFQVMEASGLGVLDAWTRQWIDLIDFEIVPVVPSSEFWASQDPRQAHPS